MKALIYLKDGTFGRNFVAAELEKDGGSVADGLARLLMDYLYEHGVDNVTTRDIRVTFGIQDPKHIRELAAGWDLDIRNELVAAVAELYGADPDDTCVELTQLPDSAPSAARRLTLAAQALDDNWSRDAQVCYVDELGEFHTRIPESVVAIAQQDPSAFAVADIHIPGAC